MKLCSSQTNNETRASMVTWGVGWGRGYLLNLAALKRLATGWVEKCKHSSQHPDVPVKWTAPLIGYPLRNGKKQREKIKASCTIELENTPGSMAVTLKVSTVGKSPQRSCRLTATSGCYQKHRCQRGVTKQGDWGHAGEICCQNIIFKDFLDRDMYIEIYCICINTYTHTRTHPRKDPTALLPEA